MANPHRKRNRSKYNPKKTKGWDPLATWYDGWVGKEGSNHHQKLTIPAVMELLHVKQGEEILDIGCGQGVLAPHLARAKAKFTGVDASDKLISLAEKRHGKIGDFLVGDATSLPGKIASKKYAAAIFMLSIQDIKDLEKAIQEASSVLSDKGRLVIVMKHPAFRIPRQSGWGTDKERKLQYRRVDSYLSHLDIPLKPYPGQSSGVSISHHRPLQNYINALGDAGLAVDKMLEISGTGVTKAKGKKEERAIKEIPLFIGIRAVKIK